jgi:AAA domain
MTKNSGLDKAIEAARLVGGYVCSPKFKVINGGSDFNDLHCAEGIEAVSAQLAIAVSEVRSGKGSASASSEAPKADSKNGVRLIKLRDLMDQPEEMIPYLVGNLLPSGGTSLMAGKPKAGKTTILRQLSLCVARGEMFLDRVCSQGPVIYFSVEEKKHEICKHFREMGATGDEPIYIFADRAPKNTIEVLRPIIKEIKPSLVILDTLFKTIRMKDSNEYAVISEALEPVQELARETNAHIMCVHHAGKAEREGGDGILGSTAIFGAFDTALIMSRDKDNKRTIKSIQRYGTGDLEETILLFDPKTRRTMLSLPKWQVKSEEIAKSILDYLRTCSELVTADQIGEELGGNKQNRTKALKYLVEAGKVVRSGQGNKREPYKYATHPNAPAN